MLHRLQRSPRQRNTPKLLMRLLTLKPPQLTIIPQLPTSSPQMQNFWRNWMLSHQNLWCPWLKLLCSNRKFMIVVRATKAAEADISPSTIIIIGAAVIFMITRIGIVLRPIRIIKNGWRRLTSWFAFTRKLWVEGRGELITMLILIHAIILLN